MLPLRRGTPSRNPITKCRLTAAVASLKATARVMRQANEDSRKASASIAQTGGNPRHRHQQRLFQRAALLRVLLPRTRQQLGLQLM